jgi:HEAT repeat protein
MLDGLDHIDWARLEHAYGSSGDVPQQIRDLRSPDEEVRKRALWHLYGNIFHQGSRYEASAYAVPFLLELLSDMDTPDRTAVAQLLASVAIGYDEAWLPEGFPVDAHRARARGGEELLRASPPIGDREGHVRYRFEYWNSLGAEAEGRIYAYIELAAYDAVRAGVPRLANILTGPGPDALRIAAIYALSWFPEEAHVSQPALRQAAADSAPAIAASALVALGLVNADAAAVADAALDDSRDVVRWAAAIALARLRGPAAGPRVAAELLAWSGGDESQRADIPFLDGDLAGYAALALRQLGEESDDSAFEALLRRAPRVSSSEALVVVAEALRRAFPHGRVMSGQTYVSLDERQRRLLTVLADAPATWRYGEVPFGNFSLMMSGYGLPSDADAMRRYIDA